MRKDDPQSISAEDLHRMLVVARWAVIQFIYAPVLGIFFAFYPLFKRQSVE